MRLLLVGAFAYPHDQGSQIYFQEQAIALRAAGAEVTLVTYGSGRAFDPDWNDDARSAEHWRALDGFEHRRAPNWSSSRSMRSGPGWGKPLADLGLATTLRDALASQPSDDAFDAILTHNGEAALVALHTLAKPRPPILYCVHTLFGNELSAYTKGSKTNGYSHYLRRFADSESLRRSLDWMGAGVDRWLARHVDGWISLTQSASRVMSQYGKAPGTLIPPPVPDPEPLQGGLDPERVARRHRLEPGRFFLYSGNLDSYQELDILGSAAAGLAKRPIERPILVVASHERKRRAPIEPTPRWAETMPGVDFTQVESAREMQALLAAARASLVMRRAEGGFPIKLANSLAVGTPAIAFREAEWGLAHEVDSLICSPDRPASSLAEAIERLASDDLLAKRLSAGARSLYLDRHVPEQSAGEVLALIERVKATRRL